MTHPTSGLGIYDFPLKPTPDYKCENTRFITPIFLHAGVVHILINMLAQWLLSARVSLIQNNHTEHI